MERLDQIEADAIQWFAESKAAVRGAIRGSATSG
jgi:hypothetical protein